jgi:hypothetical protein
MGFDLGMALGGAVNTGVNTYTKLQEEARLGEAEKRAIEADKRTAEQFQWQREKQASEQAAERAYQNTIANPSQVKEQVIPGTEGIGEEGPTIKKEAIPYSDAQKNIDYQNQLRETKGSVLHGMQLQQAGLGVKGLQRTEERAAAEDQFSKEHQEAVKLVQTDPVAWVTKNLDAYNNANKGSHLDDGFTAKIVPSADGGASFVRTDKKGKVVDSTPINTQTAMSAMQDVFFAKYQALPGKFKEGTELGLAKENVKLKGREVAAREAVVPSEIAKNFKAAYASGKAGEYYGAHAQTIGDENARKQDLFNTQKMYSDKIAALDPKASDYETKKFEISQQGEAALAMKSGDFSKIAAGTPMGRAMTSYHEAEKAYNDGKRATKPNLLETLGEWGYAPDIAKQTVEKKISDLVAAGKDKEAQVELNKFNTQFKQTPITMPTAPTPVGTSNKTNTPVTAIPTNTSSAIPGYGGAPGYSSKGAALQNIDDLKTKLATATTPVQKNNIAIQLKKEQDAFNRDYK